MVRHATDVTDGFPRHYRHPITPCNSPITPSLGPPRLGPTVRPRTTEYAKWSPTMQTASNPGISDTLPFSPDRILAGLSLRPPSCVRQFPRHPTDVLFIEMRLFLMPPNLPSL